MIEKKILKVVTEKTHSTCREMTIKITNDFFFETMETRREWSNIFKVLGESKTVNLEVYTQYGIFLKLRQNKIFLDYKR